MKKFYKLIGTALLGVASLIAIIGPVSLNSVAVEEMPESINKKR